MTATLSHPEEVSLASSRTITSWSQVADLEAYSDVPADWWVLITDVVGSTENVRRGRYRDVNAVGAASIIAALNGANGEPVGYVFGGDGALVLGPPSCRAQVERAVGHAQTLARDAFGLELRAGLLPMAELLAMGGEIRMLGFRPVPGPLLVMLDGKGLHLAEAQIKGADTAERWALPPAPVLDVGIFEGFECRWQPIPSQRGAMVTLLVVPRGDRAQRSATLHACFDQVARIAGADPPLREEAMRLSFTVGSREASVFTGRAGGWSHLRERLVAGARVGIGQLLLSTGKRGGSFDGATYKRSLLERTDHRKYDGVLRMVLDLSPEELSTLRTTLEAMRAEGRLDFGLHANEAAVLTCFVRDYAEQHVHFIDGSDGGYAMAAVELKKQLAELKSPGC